MQLLRFSCRWMYLQFVGLKDMSSELFFDDSCWDIILTSYWCEVQGIIHYRPTISIFFSSVTDPSSISSSSKYTSSCLKFFKQFTEICSANRFIRNTCIKHLFCLMKITVDLDVNRDLAPSEKMAWWTTLHFGRGGYWTSQCSFWRTSEIVIIDFL